MPAVTFQCFKVQQPVDFYPKEHIICQRCQVDKGRLLFSCALLSIHTTSNTVSLLTLHCQHVTCPGGTLALVSSLIQPFSLSIETSLSHIHKAHCLWMCHNNTDVEPLGVSFHRQTTFSYIAPLAFRTVFLFFCIDLRHPDQK